MSDTYKAGKYTWPREYWSKRTPLKVCGWGWFGKLMTHRFERRLAKTIIREQLNSND